MFCVFFFFQAEDGIRDRLVTGVQTCALPIYSTSGNYYQEIICDPKDVDKVFSMNTWLHHTEDGGKSFKRTGEKDKHVDNHCIWIDPVDTDHWRIGCEDRKSVV